MADLCKVLIKFLRCFVVAKAYFSRNHYLSFQFRRRSKRNMQKLHKLFVSLASSALSNVTCY